MKNILQKCSHKSHFPQMPKVAYQKLHRKKPNKMQNVFACVQVYIDLIPTRGCLLDSHVAGKDGETYPLPEHNTPLSSVFLS